MSRFLRLFPTVVVTATLVAVGGPVAADASWSAASPMRVDATSLSFAGYREPVPPSTATQTAITVAPTGSCVGLSVSVGIGAEQRGASSMLGARVYSQCISGVQTITATFETTGGPIPMSTIGALAPNDVVAIRIFTAAGLTTVTATGPLGSDTMSVPDIVSTGYRVGAWPVFANHANAKMPNFGTIKIYKNTVNSVPMGTTGWTKVHMVYASLVQRVKTSPWNAANDVFKLKWLNP